MNPLLRPISQEARGDWLQFLLCLFLLHQSPWLNPGRRQGSIWESSAAAARGRPRAPLWDANPINKNSTPLATATRHPCPTSIWMQPLRPWSVMKSPRR
ncbi:hypothetical protein B0T17DRAFT_544403 [Bombardia bombarda]|uniref:Uncharacterized protein n=1 Tax=Bombardia bombarda TaxID=252184 RepID=A0AA39T108_9PEZI|nr:hypothetical protein B0T17DRAFT_544403 [Bombardia bombarda]